jgi:hypothetical protein
MSKMIDSRTIIDLIREAKSLDELLEEFGQEQNMSKIEQIKSTQTVAHHAAQLLDALPGVAAELRHELVREIVERALNTLAEDTGRLDKSQLEQLRVFCRVVEGS